MQLTIEMMKLMNNLIKKFLRPEKIKATAIATPTPIFEICQFVINNRLGHFDQLTITMEIIQTVYNGKIDEIDKKIIEVQRN